MVTPFSRRTARDDAEWIDVTVMGSAYDQQVDVRSNRRRHRLSSRQCDFPGDGSGPYAVGEWMDGPAPD